MEKLQEEKKNLEEANCSIVEEDHATKKDRDQKVGTVKKLLDVGKQLREFLNYLDEVKDKCVIKKLEKGNTNGTG